MAPHEPLHGTGHALTRGCSFRAILVGVFGALIMAVGIPYGDMIIKGSRMGVWNTLPAAIFLFFVLVAGINLVLGAIHRNLALDRSELAVVYIILMIANTLPARGFSGYVPPIATGAYYYATPENNWKEIVQPVLPRWATVQDPQAVERYYEGASGDTAIPWDAWGVPVLFWLVFGLSLWLVMLSITVILRKQWVDNERLNFPSMQLPLLLIRDDERGSAIKPLLRNPLLWIGVALPLLVNMVSAFHDYYPHVPEISMNFGTARLFRDTVSLGFGLSFTLVGFGYFVSKNIAAGLCFFHLLNLVEQGAFNVLGIAIADPAVGVFAYAGPLIRYQAFGAMIILVLTGLFNARRHLLDVARKAFLGARDVDDSAEIMSYRQAVFGFIGGSVVMSLWLWQAGMPLVGVPLLLFGCFVLFMTFTRVVAEGGVVVLWPPLVGPDWTASMLGTRFLGHTGAAAIATTYVWGTDILILMMSACGAGMKLTQAVGRHRRRLFWGIAAAIVLTVVVSLWVRLSAGYAHGAINLNQFYGINAAQYPYQFMQNAINSPVGPNWDAMAQMCFGAAAMLLLELAHYKLLWWPFHPLGFPISSVFGGMWFSMLFALIFKSVVLQYGGPAIYRKLMPVFLGLIIGDIVPAGIWLIIDYFTGMSGNILGSFMA
jgi:uncharacterized protein DUF6785/uncharacterized protein DUF6784